MNINNNYSKLNPSLNYGMNYSGSDYNDSKSFSMFQDGLSNVKSGAGNGQGYYCGGNSTLHMKETRKENSQLSNLFFSRENMNRIQKKIRKELRRQSDGNIKLVVDLDELELGGEMKKIFEENGKHLPHNIVRQVKQLNSDTVDYVVSYLLTGLRQNATYLKNLDKPIQTMNLPINVNTGGRKTLPSVTSIWGF